MREQPIDPQVQMLAIAREMKEIPELPSEAPKDVSHLTHVEFVDGGGVHTFISGHEEPYKGYPYHEFVEKIDVLKKIWRGALSSFFHSLKKRNPLQISLLALVPWLFSDLVEGALYSSHRVIARFRFKKERYCTAMRELHRAFGDKNEALRDIVCMVLENDNAYRYRFQDVMVELDKIALRKNPGKELTRLLSIMQTRETGQDLVDTWTLLKTFLPPFLIFNGKMRKLIVSVLEELDLEKIALDNADKWYATPRKDYICNFRTNPTEEDKVLLERVNRKNQKDEAQAKVREDSTKAHEALFQRHMQELGVTEEEQRLIQTLDNQLVGEINAEAAREYDKRRKQVRKQVFGDRFPTLERQQQEIAQLDKEWNDKLQAIT